MNKKQKEEQFTIGLISILLLDFALFILGIIWYVIFKNNLLVYEWSIVLGIVIGLCQYLYVIPIAIWQKTKGNKKLVFGIIIGSLVVLAISAFLLLRVAIFFYGFPF